MGTQNLHVVFKYKTRVFLKKQKKGVIENDLLSWLVYFLSPIF